MAATLALVRIDSRLIHGQVMAKWMKQTGANRIIVVDDKLAKDSFMSKIYTMAAPPGVKVEIVTVADAVAAWNRDQFGDGRIIMLFKDVQTALQARNQGLAFSELQVGGLAGAPGRKVVFQNITLDQKDAEDLNRLQEGGVNVYLQTIPEDTPASLSTVLKNLKS